MDPLHRPPENIVKHQYNVVEVPNGPNIWCFPKDVKGKNKPAALWKQDNPLFFLLLYRYRLRGGLFPQDRLGGGQARDGHTVRGAGDVIQPRPVAELDRPRIP